MTLRSGKVLQFEIEQGYLSSHISASEIVDIEDDILSNTSKYVTDFRNLRNKLSALRQSAEDMERTRSINLRTQADLTAARKAKQAELDRTKATLRALNQAAETSRQASRNFGKEHERLNQQEKKKLLQELEYHELRMKALHDKIKMNDEKIKGVVPIDHNDLAESHTKLRNTLSFYQETFLQQDPRFTAIGEVIKGLPGTITSVGPVIQ